MKLTVWALQGGGGHGVAEPSAVDEFAHKFVVGRVDVGGLCVHHEWPDRRIDLYSDLSLQAGKLNEVPVRLLAEVERVRVNDKLERFICAPEVEK